MTTTKNADENKKKKGFNGRVRTIRENGEGKTRREW
jgi:hypothetical protein